MSHWLCNAIRLPIVGRTGQSVPSHVSQQRRYARPYSIVSLSNTKLRRPTGNRPRSTSIQTLDDDSILNIFHFYRPVVLDEGVVGWVDIIQDTNWSRERWWYKPAHVCRRWRYLILGSASHLRLCLLCTYKTPVADMLAHSPPLPLVIDHRGPRTGRTVENEESMLLALQHRDRLRRIHIVWPLPNLQKFIMAMDGEFPILEYLYVARPSKNNTSLVLPHTFQAPRLRYLILIGFAFPTGRPLFPTAVDIVTLALQDIHSSANFRLNDLFHILSLLPQLGALTIGFHFPFPNRDVRTQLLQMSDVPHLTLPNLRHFAFEGVSTYLEILLPRMTAPHLEKLRIQFSNQLTFSVPCLRDFIRKARNLHFDVATFSFYGRGIVVILYPPERNYRVYTLSIHVFCRHLDWQVSSMEQIFTVLSPVFSEVVELALYYRKLVSSPEWHYEADRTQWRNFLRSFLNVKTLYVDKDLTGDLSRSLRPADGEPSVDLLPELKELKCSTDSHGDAFSSFIDARQLAGRPVTLVRR